MNQGRRKKGYTEKLRSYDSCIILLNPKKCCALEIIINLIFSFIAKKLCAEIITDILFASIGCVCTNSLRSFVHTSPLVSHKTSFVGALPPNTPCFYGTDICYSSR